MYDDATVIFYFPVGECETNTPTYPDLYAEFLPC